MPMKNPGHPGRQIREELDFLEVSVADAAAALGIMRQQLYNVISGKSGITPEMAVRFEKGIGGTAEGWIALQSAFDLAQARARAGAMQVARLLPKAGGEQPGAL